MHMKKVILLGVTLSLAIAPAVWAKKKPKTDSVSASLVQSRVDALSSEDQRKFDSLSQEQKDKIARGEIEPGFNEWMVETALGKPFFATEHHPVFTDFQQVWLYTKPEVIETVNEETIIDPQTNWPTVHRKTTKKTCNISDYFVLWDRGVVQDIRKATERSVHGSCTIENQEAFLPIVDEATQKAPPHGKKSR